MSLCVKGYLIVMPLSIILWSGMWVTIVLYDQPLKSTYPRVPTASQNSWEMGGGEAIVPESLKNVSAVFTTFIKNRLPEATDTQVPGSAAFCQHFYVIKDQVFFNLLKYFFMEERWVLLDSPSLFSYNVKNLIKYIKGLPSFFFSFYNGLWVWVYWTWKKESRV